MKYMKNIMMAGILLGVSGIYAMDRPGGMDEGIIVQLNDHLVTAAEKGEVQEFKALLHTLAEHADTCQALEMGARHPEIVLALAQHCCCKNKSAHDISVKPGTAQQQTMFARQGGIEAARPATSASTVYAPHTLAGRLPFIEGPAAPGALASRRQRQAGGLLSEEELRALPDIPSGAIRIIGAPARAQQYDPSLYGSATQTLKNTQ